VDAKNNTKTKIEVKNDLKDVTSQVEKLDQPISTEIIAKTRNDMSNNTTQNPNNTSCEAVGCYSKADGMVHIKVGTKGVIPLFLCIGCRSKFHLDEFSSDAH
jgi:hypothetical protein